MVATYTYLHLSREQGVTSTDFYSQSASLLFTIVTVLAILEVSSLHSVTLYYACKCPIANSSNKIATCYSQK